MNRQKTSPSIAVLLVSLAAVFIIILGIQTTASILNPILLAIIITIVVMPVPQKLAERGLPAWLSFVVTFLAVIALIAFVLFLIFSAFTQISADASVEMTSPENSPITAEQVNQFFGAIVRWAGHAVALVVTVLIIFIFMLSAAITMPATNRLGLSASNEVLTQVAQLTEDVRSYMSIMTGINFLVGLGDAFLLWILGVPYPLVWGLLAWFMGYIPTVGFWIAMIPPVILAWTTIGPQSAAIVFAGFVLINGSVQNFVQPRMMGQGLGISPVVVFISLIFWGFLLGGVGAILAVPLTMIVMAVLNAYPNTRWLAILMSVPKKEQDDGDRKQAHANLKHTWGSIKHSIGMKGDVDDSGDTGDATDSNDKDNDNDS
jgi:AI-2 transport protein TqsA